jgi:hypothetical protein
MKTALIYYSQNGKPRKPAGRHSGPRRPNSKE